MTKKDRKIVKVIIKMLDKRINKKNNMTKTDGKKVTLATIKSFIKREMSRDNLYIKNLSTFDGSQDMVVEVVNEGFRKAKPTTNNPKYTLGVSTAWFVGDSRIGDSRNYFEAYDDGIYTGYKVYNCCGSFILAMKYNDLLDAFIKDN